MRLVVSNMGSIDGQEAARSALRTVLQPMIAHMEFPDPSEGPLDRVTVSECDPLTFREIVPVIMLTLRKATGRNYDVVAARAQTPHRIHSPDGRVAGVYCFDI